MRCLPVAVLLISLVTSPGAAQSLRGRLVGPDSVTAVSSALVLLQDSTGRTIDQAVTSDAGRFEVGTLRPGVFGLRVLRIGYAPWRGAVTLASGEVLDRLILLAGARIALPEIVVEGTRMCGARAESDSLGSVLWGQARTALALANDGLRSREYRFATVVEDRVVDIYGTSRPVGPSTSLSALATAWPIRSLPADSLLRYGFILNREDVWAGPTWFGPDADFLLSETFFAGHCFRTLPPAVGLPAEWVGLSFEPAVKSKLTDVRGTLWLDRSSAELRRIDYGYTRLPSWARGRDAGGTLSFATLSDGGWVVQRWSMRVPMPKVNVRTEQAVFFGYRESAGRVAEVFSPAGAIIQSFPP